MKFIKVFADDAAYKAYRDSGNGYIRPNVSLSRHSKTVFYNLDANGKEYVDLGLPSGTLWATMNVGASKPSDAGLYFQWGDISGYTASQVQRDPVITTAKISTYSASNSITKPTGTTIDTSGGITKPTGTTIDTSGRTTAEDTTHAFTWKDYKWSIDGSDTNFSKYTTAGATLELADDAAHVHMGGDWHIPTPIQIQELIDNTTTALTTSDDVSGMTFTSTKDTSKFIFIPAVGKAFDGSVQDSGDFGYFWSTNLDMNEVYYGNGIILEDDTQFPGFIVRCCGLSVRGVLG